MSAVPPTDQGSTPTVSIVADATTDRLRRLERLAMVEHVAGDRWRATATREEGFRCAIADVDVETWAAIESYEGPSFAEFDALDLDL